MKCATLWAVVELLRITVHCWSYAMYFYFFILMILSIYTLIYYDPVLKCWNWAATTWNAAIVPDCILLSPVDHILCACSCVADVAVFYTCWTPNRPSGTMNKWPWPWLGTIQFHFHSGFCDQYWTISNPFNTISYI